jgi:hypothetical protein
MKSTEEDYIKLKKALSAAYLEKEKAEVSDLWRIRVMSHVRKRGSIESKVDYFELFERFVWRLAPVACALILVLAAAVTQLDFVSDYEMVKMFIEDPADFSLLALYNG